jgi:hypothetical protein
MGTNRRISNNCIAGYTAAVFKSIIAGINASTVETDNHPSLWGKTKNKGHEPILWMFIGYQVGILNRK